MPSRQLRRYEELLESLGDGSLDVDQFARAFRVLWLEDSEDGRRLSAVQQRLVDSVGEAVGTFDNYRGVKATGADADGLRRLASSVLHKLRGEVPLSDEELPEGPLRSPRAEPPTLLKNTLRPTDEDMITQLRSSERVRRREAASYFAERFNDARPQSSYRRGAIGRIADALVRAAETETDGPAREIELTALAGTDDLPYAVVEPLVAVLPSYTDREIRLCLAILGTTRWSAAEPVLGQYLDHPDPQVRDDATDALVELRHRRRQRAH